jgi:hypothetical protein
MAKPDLDSSLPEKARAAWASASKAEQEAAVRHATQFLDTLPFKGRRATDTQALSWPRSGVFRDDGAPIIGVPDEIKDATALVAAFIVAGIPFSPTAVAFVFMMIGHLVEDGVSLSDSEITWH